MLLTTVGVPERTHVLESESPEGRDGETLQETMVPPLFETPMDVMAVPTARVKKEGENVMEGAMSFVAKVMVVEAEPAELFAQTV